MTCGAPLWMDSAVGAWTPSWGLPQASHADHGHPKPPCVSEQPPQCTHSEIRPKVTCGAPLWMDPAVGSWTPSWGPPQAIHAGHGHPKPPCVSEQPPLGTHSEIRLKVTCGAPLWMDLGGGAWTPSWGLLQASHADHGHPKPPCVSEQPPQCTHSEIRLKVTCGAPLWMDLGGGAWTPSWGLPQASHADQGHPKPPCVSEQPPQCPPSEIRPKVTCGAPLWMDSAVGAWTPSWGLPQAGHADHGHPKPPCVSEQPPLGPHR